MSAHKQTNYDVKCFYVTKSRDVGREQAHITKNLHAGINLKGTKMQRFCQMTQHLKKTTEKKKKK